jgi:hypothetical protein
MNSGKSKVDILEFWVQLGKARCRKDSADQERNVDPWDSKDPQVKSAWKELTNPEHLAALEEWSSKPEQMNPVAQVASAKAIECCKARIATGLS